MTSRSIIIHGHFYQPPREDPWFGEVAREPSAAPWHDWNERIDHECYRAVIAARVRTPAGRIERLVNTLERISYDAGPTLLAWMERESPDTHAAFVAADRESRKRTGFGNAVGMPYHHVILPLCSRRDKETEVRWGIRDFERRFGRRPEGMWLPEAAVDDETLDVLAAEGIRFTILGAGQVRQVPAAGLPGRYRTAGGHSIAIFVYDGGISHDVAFGPLVRDDALWAERMLSGGHKRRLVSMATDGETWGHHHKSGEVILARVLDRLAAQPGVRVENFTSFLSRHPPEEDIEVVSPSSWSCPHGVERWRSDCGCKIAPHLESQQKWRAPLRDALDWLAGELHQVFEREGAKPLGDPWKARDESGPIAPESAGGEDVRTRELLEMERNALAMFTSCGWFFDDVSGVETLVVLRHAARAIELAGAAAGRLQAGLLERLKAAASNVPEVGDAAQIFRSRVVTSVSAPRRAAIGFAAARLVSAEPDAQLPGYALQERGAHVEVRDRRTGRRWSENVGATRPTRGRIALDLPLDQLPERHQRLVRQALARAVVERWIEPGQLEPLLAGAAGVQSITAEALTSSVQALAESDSDESLERVGDLLDLARLLDVDPVDAQIRFHQVLTCASEDGRARLADLTARFGFVSS